MIPEGGSLAVPTDHSGDGSGRSGLGGRSRDPVLLEEHAQVVVGYRQARNLVGVLLDGGVDLQRLRHGIAVGSQQGVADALGQLVHLGLDGCQGLDQGKVLLELAQVHDGRQDVGVSRGHRVGLLDEGGVAVGGLEQRPHLCRVQRDQEVQLGADVVELLEDVVLGGLGQGGRNQVLCGHGNCLL